MPNMPPLLGIPKWNVVYMQIDSRIYVARPDLIGLGDFDRHDLDTALAEDAEDATAISVLGGYFNVDALKRLCLNVPGRPASEDATAAFASSSASMFTCTWSLRLRQNDGLRLRKIATRRWVKSLVSRVSRCKPFATPTGRASPLLDFKPPGV